MPTKKKVKGKKKKKKKKKQMQAMPPNETQMHQRKIERVLVRSNAQCERNLFFSSSRSYSYNDAKEC
jgi:hypothetical protein